MIGHLSRFLRKLQKWQDTSKAIYVEVLRAFKHV